MVSIFFTTVSLPNLPNNLSPTLISQAFLTSNVFVSNRELGAKQ